VRAHDVVARCIGAAVGHGPRRAGDLEWIVRHAMILFNEIIFLLSEMSVTVDGLV
jgi:hypothetical protein